MCKKYLRCKDIKIQLDFQDLRKSFKFLFVKLENEDSDESSISKPLQQIEVINMCVTNGVL